MSDSNRIAMAYVKETTYGTTPGTQMTDQRFTTESLGADTGVISSTEIRPDRQVVDVIRNSLQASGDVGFELSYGAYDDWFEAALLSAAWTAVVNVTQGSTWTLDATAKTITATSGTPFSTLAANRWIEVRGFSTAGNNGYLKIASVSGTVITWAAHTGTPANETLTGTGGTVQQGARILNGTTLTTFSIEKQYKDLTAIFEILRGMAPDRLALNIAADQIVTGTFSFLGKEAKSAAATGGTGTNASAPGNPVYNSIDNVIAVLENNAKFATTAFSLALANNLRARLQVGTLGPISLGTGTCAVTGTLQAYFTDAAIMDKYLNATASQIAVVVEESTGVRAQVIDLPQVEYTSGRRVAGGQNTDIIADLAFTAYRDVTEDLTLSITRFA